MPGKWDGRSRIPTQLYKDNYNRIFNVKAPQKATEAKKDIEQESVKRTKKQKTTNRQK